MALGGTEDSRFSFIDWSELLKSIQLESASSKVHQVLTGVYELVLELIQIQAERNDAMTQLELKSCDCLDLQKTLDAKTTLLEELGSTIVKLEETRNLDVYLPEAYRILSTDLDRSTPKECNSKSELINKNPRQTKKENVPPQEGDPPRKKDLEKAFYNGLKQEKDKSNPAVDKNQANTEAIFEIENGFKLAEVIDVDAIEEGLGSTTSSDVSIAEDSMYEIQGTPTGRKSPVILSKVFRKAPSNQKSSGVVGSPKSKANSSPARHKRKQVKLSQPKMSLYLRNKKNSVNLTSVEELGGGALCDSSASASDPKLDSMRMSTEDEDIILPSPTSETIRNTFSTKSRISCEASTFLEASPRASTPPVRPTTPPIIRPTMPPVRPTTPPPVRPIAPPVAMSQDETDILASSVDFDEPMDMENSLDASMDLMQGHSLTMEPGSPVLCDGRNRSNTPARRHRHDTEVSVSVLRQPFRSAWAGRENVAPVKGQPRSPIKRSPKKKSPVKNKLTTQDAHESISLLRDYVVPDEMKVVDKKCEPERVVHVYKEETVRKRAEKMKLPGWLCEQCRNYIESFYKEDPIMMKNMIEKCSKHRGKFNPARPKTPTGFWDVHLSVPEDTEELNRLNNVD